jgi:aquaporin Z
VRQRCTRGVYPDGGIGLCLTLIHLISIPVTNTSVNTARSTGVAVYVADWAISRLWLFWLVPIIAAVIYRYIGNPED